MKRANIPLLCTGLSIIAATSSCSQHSKRSVRPNIIYILADDLGYGDLGCYGQSKIETPNIDRLAAEGVRYSQFYVGAPVSAPSRCITFTGLHSGHAYIRGNDEMGSRGKVWDHAAMLADSFLEGQRPIPAGTVTVQSVLQQAGYRTGCVGKWGLGYPGSEGAPNKTGFDFFYGYNCQRQAHTYFPPFLYRNETREYLPNKLLPPGNRENFDPLDPDSYAQYAQQAYSPDLMLDEILNFVGENASQPFFLAWTTTLPHLALQAPERWVEHYVDKFGDEEPYVGSGYFPCRYPHATYAAMVSFLDEQVGRLVERLKELGIYENTVIIFTSDNGPARDAGIDSPWFDSARPFRSGGQWGKGFLREGGIRVPLIVSWKDNIRAGNVCDHICAAWDVMPTLCELAGATIPPTDGLSFLPSLLGNEQPAHEYLYWEFPEGEGQKAIRIGQWKGLIRNIREAGEDHLMLFDLTTDPTEHTDLASEHPEIVEMMRARMLEAHTDSPIERFQM